MRILIYGKKYSGWSLLGRHESNPSNFESLTTEDATKVFALQLMKENTELSAKRALELATNHVKYSKSLYLLVQDGKGEYGEYETFDDYGCFCCHL